MSNKFICHPLSRIVGTTLLVLSIELVRQTTYVHAWLHRDLVSAGVFGVSADIFQVPPSRALVWNLWLGVLVTCFLLVSDLYRERLGSGWLSTFRAGTLVWAATFGIAWLSFLAFGLVSNELVFAALLGAWGEATIVARVAMRWPVYRAAAEDLAPTRAPAA